MEEYYPIGIFSGSLLEEKYREKVSNHICEVFSTNFIRLLIKSDLLNCLLFSLSQLFSAATYEPRRAKSGSSTLEM
jgi:hypothetical protein